jgi:hypothetical protein
LFIPERTSASNGGSKALSDYAEGQRDMFGRNAAALASAIKSAIEDLPSWRQRVARLREGLSAEYFSREAHAAQVFNVLFGGSLQFVSHERGKSSHLSKSIQ